MDKLRQIVQTMAETAREAGVSIITGDTKVVERGGPTASISIPPAWARCLRTAAQRRKLPARRCHPVSGTLGDHGIAIMSQREGLAFSSTIEATPHRSTA